RWLCDELHRRGVPSPRGGAFWTAGTVRGILVKREYVGDLDWGRVFSGGYHGLERREITPKGRKALNDETKRRRAVRLKPEDFVIVADTHQPLIDRAMWEKVQAKLAGSSCIEAGTGVPARQVRRPYSW